MRIPLAVNLESRDGTVDQDAKVLNGVVEPKGEEETRLVKRPGLASFTSTPTAGAGQGLHSGLNLLSFVGDKICWITSRTDNYLNPANKHANVTLSNNNLTATTTAAIGGVTGALSCSQGGVAYVEVTIGSAAGGQRIGVSATAAVGIAGAPGTYTVAGSNATDAYDIAYDVNGKVYAFNTEAVDTTITATAGDIIGMAIYMDRATSTSQFAIKWFKNGSLIRTETTYGTNARSNASGGPFMVIGTSASGGASTINFGATPFTYTIPTTLECAIAPTNASQAKWWSAETNRDAATRYFLLHNGKDAYSTVNPYPQYGSGSFTSVSNLTGPFAGGIAYLDGYFFVMDKSAKISNSGSENVTFGALDYLYAKAFRGEGRYLARTLQYIVALKEWSTEWFYNAGNPTGSVLSAVGGSARNIGCADGLTAANVADSIFFVGQETGGKRGVYRIRGLEMTKVSTPAIDKVLELSTLASNVAMGTTVNGRGLYILTLGDLSQTFVYDETASMWGQWSQLTAGSNKTVSTITRSGTTATFNTSTAHGMSDGDPTTIAGANEAAFNGLVQISYVDTDTFTAEVTVTTISVTSITRSGTTATVTTASSHGYTNGQKVTIAGATQTDYNGTYTITTTGVDTYTYTVANSPATPATGTITSTTPGETGSGTITATPYTESNFGPKASATFGTRHLMLGASNAKVYELDPATYRDDSIPINFNPRTIKLDGGNDDRKKLGRITVIGDKVSATAMIRWSDDDYTTNSAYRRVDLSDESPMLRRCGAFRRRSIELRHIANTALAIDALELEIGR